MISPPLDTAARHIINGDEAEIDAYTIEDAAEEFAADLWKMGLPGSLTDWDVLIQRDGEEAIHRVSIKVAFTDYYTSFTAAIVHTDHNAGRRCDMTDDLFGAAP